MTDQLYPLLFSPTYHYRIWGGNRLKEFKKNIDQDNIGESWEISTVPYFVSIVSNGNLKGHSLIDLIRTYKEQLTGTKVYQKFGNEFPLLIKFLDSAEPLSIQVHPNDEYAKAHHNSFGKTEMWYIIDADYNSEIIIGFRENITKGDFIQSIKENKIENTLRKIHPKKGDIFYIPSGRVHAMGKGITLAEIQQTSDVTYRIYDYDRIDKNGEKRELHIDQSLDVIDFSFVENATGTYDRNSNEVVLAESSYFTTSRWVLKSNKAIDNNGESFKILICTEGEGIIEFENGSQNIRTGQTLLIPACLQNITIKPNHSITLLEVHID